MNLLWPEIVTSRLQPSHVDTCDLVDERGNHMDIRISIASMKQPFHRQSVCCYACGRSNEGLKYE